MARAGALPSFLTRTHPKYKTPTGALVFQTGINVVLGLLLPLVIGVANVYNLTGTWFTFALAIVYVAANVGLPVYYKREHPDEFNVFKHIVIPAIGTIGLILVVFYSVNPLPDWPINLAPFIVLAWLVIGIIVQAVVFTGTRAAVLSKAGAAMGETEPERV
jgi:amino acid transporter